jgi:hypothetical protein
MERLLARLDDPRGDDPGTIPVKLRLFQMVLAMVVCADYWTRALLHRDGLVIADLIELAVVTPLAIAILQGGFRRAACAGLACLQALYIVRYFPQAGNHRYLELLLAALFAVLDDEDEEERRLLLRSLRFLVLVVLFWSGAQKVLHGYWFRGEYLAFALWRPTFAGSLGALIAPDELQRLTGYAALPGDGPYRARGLALPLLGNAVWIGELALAALLFLSRSRAAACALGVLFVLAMEVVAREAIFGLELACGILLFARGARALRVAAWAAAFTLIVLLAMRLELLPAVVFH